MNAPVAPSRAPGLVASAVAGVLYTAISPAAAFIHAGLLMGGALLAFTVAGRR